MQQQGHSAAWGTTMQSIAAARQLVPPSKLTRHATPPTPEQVGPGQRVECDFRPGRGQRAADGEGGALSPRRAGGGRGADGSAGGWEDQEDEDAFLDCLLQVRGGLHPAACCSRALQSKTADGPHLPAGLPAGLPACQASGLQSSRARRSSAGPTRPVQEELRAAGQAAERPPAILKFKAPGSGSKEWQHPCVLLPGCHEAGPDADVLVSKSCATTHIVLAPPSGPRSSLGGPHAPAGATPLGGSAPEAAPEDKEQQQPLPVLPLQLLLHLRQVQVCLWEDERRRLLPAPARQPSGSDSNTPLALGTELFCLTADGLQLMLARYAAPAVGPPAAAAAPRQRSPAAEQGPQAPCMPCAHARAPHLLVYQAQLALSAVQLDSFLPDSEHPVLLSSVAEGGARSGGGGGLHPPLHMLLEVHHAPPPWPGGRMSFRNAWVHRVLARLPTLAVCVDDSLLLIATRAQQLLDGFSGGEAHGDSAEAAGLSSGPAAAGPQQPREGSAPAAARQLAAELAAEAAGAASRWGPRLRAAAAQRSTKGPGWAPHEAAGRRRPNSPPDTQTQSPSQPAVHGGGCGGADSAAGGCARGGRGHGGRARGHTPVRRLGRRGQAHCPVEPRLLGAAPALFTGRAQQLERLPRSAACSVPAARR